MTSTSSSRCSGMPVAVEGVTGLEQLEELRGAIGEHDPADGRAVVEPEAVRFQGRDEPADPTHADVRGEVPQVDVDRGGGEGRCRRQGRSRRCRQQTMARVV